MEELFMKMQEGKKGRNVQHKELEIITFKRRKKKKITVTTLSILMADDSVPRETVAVTVVEEKSDAKETNMVVAKSIKMKRIMLPLTIVSFILSLPILFSFIWLFYMQTYDCEALLKLSKLQIGIAVGLIILFVTSNVVVYLRSKFPALGLLLVMVPLILMLTVGLGLVGAFNMETRRVPGSPRWLKMEVHNNNNWNEIKSCIYDTRTCKDLVSRSYVLKSYDFTTSKLTPIESGCCVPPMSCEMVYVNATFWKKGDISVDSSVPYDRDCDLWQNDETALCYDCQACKEGFLKPLKSKWEKLGVFLIVMSLLLIVLHLIMFIATMFDQFAG